MGKIGNLAWEVTAAVRQSGYSMRSTHRVITMMRITLISDRPCRERIAEICKCHVEPGLTQSYQIRVISYQFTSNLLPQLVIRKT